MSKPNFNEKGLALESGLIEFVETGDALAGTNNEHVGKIKLFVWQGPEYIRNINTDMAGLIGY